MDIKDLKEKELLLGYYFQRKQKQQLSMLSLFYMWRNWFKHDFLMDGKNLLAVKDDRLGFKPKTNCHLKKQYKDRLNEYGTAFKREYECIKKMVYTMNEQDFIKAIEAERKRGFGMILKYLRSNNINVYIQSKRGIEGMRCFSTLKDYAICTKKKRVTSGSRDTIIAYLKEHKEELQNE